MTTLAMVLLGVVCWCLRILFILVVPADRLPARVQSSLTRLAPATLAAVVAIETDAAVRGANTTTTVYVLATIAVIIGVVVRTGSLLYAIGTSLVAALVLDLVVLG
jgi:branched-subunit amino acid transport protein